MSVLVNSFYSFTFYGTINLDYYITGDLLWTTFRLKTRKLGNKNYFPQNEQADFPDCSLRFYTLSEILNAVIRAGFNIREFNEHPNWDDKKISGEFTVYAVK